MTQRKKLIEVALPLEAINVASAREKSIRHGHPSTLHLWWARRPLAAARAVIFSSLVDDPDSPDALPAFVEACKALPVGPNVHANGDTPRMRLFDFIERLVQWESTTNEEILNTARELIMIATEGNPPPLLDPFAGGGTIPLEAQRLGLEAHASDLNPVAVMINKAQIEIPPRFANQPPVNPRDRAQMFGGSTGPAAKKGKGKASTPAQDGTWKGAAGLAADVRYYGEWMREKAWERIGHLYPTHNGEPVIAWLWARTVKSPNPAVNAQVPLMRSFVLSNKKGQEIWAKPIIEANKVYFRVTQGKPPKGGQDGTVVHTGATCIISGEPIPFEYIREEGKAGRMGIMPIAIVTDEAGGRKIHSFTEDHITAANLALPDGLPVTDIPDQALSFRVQLYGLDQHWKLFTARQLHFLVTISQIVAEARAQFVEDISLISQDKSYNDLYTDAITTYLAMIVSKLTVTSNTLSIWRTNEMKVGRAFGRQNLPMVWDFPETNPFTGTAGDVSVTIDGMCKAMENLPAISQGVVHQADAQSLEFNDTSAMSVSTDPPYYDNVNYADLSDFFYAWLRPILRETYPDIFTTILTPKDKELIATPFRFGGKKKANEHFEKGLLQTFQKLRQGINPNYPITVYYAFKQSEVVITESEKTVGSTGWETMLESITKSGFAITGTWPMRTETSVALKTSINSLASSIVLVCRPRATDAPSLSRRQFIDSLRRELPAALKDMQSGNIAPVDLAQASIGPGMGIYSRYSAVLEADGTPMSVRTALGLINQELDAYLAEQDGEIDPDTRFAVAWFEQFDFRDGEFGHADVLARAKNTSVAGVESARLVASGRGKVRLIHWKEYDPGAWNPQSDKRPTVWEATHHLIERLNTHGETGSAQLMLSMPPEMAAEARNLAYRLYSICERKGWAEHARDYNALVISWAGIGEETARLRENEARGSATNQPRLFE